ncbi:MAG: SAM-dependent methyltransferase, partial [Actinobacteria bacterium]|nr:SAM-dependent methyltransferase [Actinomycetota bacterium]
MPEDLATALAALRPLLLDTGALLRAVAAGRRRGAPPAVVRAELR